LGGAGGHAAPATSSPRPQPVAPSERLRILDPIWVELSSRREFRSLGEIEPRGRLAVVAHLYYPDLWDEISAAIANIEEPFDLFITLVAGAADGLAGAIRQRWPFAHVLTVENHGRDILPFLAILQSGVLFRYELTCKLHTKRSHWHGQGDAWRRNLIGGVLANPRAVRRILAAFRTMPDLGMVVANGEVYSGRELWVGNEKHLLPLLQAWGLDRSAFDSSFAGGSIFWIRSAVLQAVRELRLGFDDFEPEPIGKDGSMAHAVERLISLACYDAGMTIKETGAILAQLDRPRPTLEPALAGGDG
jgi:lipopolysaccharide biosynthesis protein